MKPPELSQNYQHADGHVCWWQHPKKGTASVGFIVTATGVSASAKPCPHAHDWEGPVPPSREDALWDE